VGPVSPGRGRSHGRVRGPAADPSREPLPERHFGARIGVIERWDFGDGRKSYAGCVRFPNDVAWMTNLQFSPDESFVTGKLQDAAAGNPYPAPAK